MLRRCGFLAFAVLAGCGPQNKPVSAPAATPEAPREAADAPETAAVKPQTEAPAEDSAPPQQADPNDCNPFVAPVTRTGGNLTVDAPPRKSERPFGSRMRTHVDGTLSANAQRIWVGPQVPGFVPLVEGTAELFLLNHQSDGTFLAFYRDPYGASSCTLGGSENCAYAATHFAHCGEVLWSISLNELLSDTKHLEVQDIQLDGDTLYFNEACQSYSKDAKGKCSALVAVDPKANQVLWRTKPLVSNGEFFIADGYVVAGYGFTAERDNLHVVRRSDGKVVQTLRFPKAPESIRLLEPGVIEVTVYPGNVTRRYRMTDWSGARPKLVRLKD